MRKICYLIMVAGVVLSSCSSESNFKKGKDGMEYKIVSKGKGEKIGHGNFMQLIVKEYYDTGKEDSLLVNPRGDMPMIQVLDTTQNFPKDLYGIFTQLRNGDSVVMRFLSDSAIKKNPGQLPPFIKPGHYLLQTFKIKNVFTTKAQADSAAAAEVKLAEQRQELKDKEQVAKDDKTLAAHFAKNNIKATKTQNGTYVEIITPGTGNLLDTNSVAKVNYTGRVLNGNVFDSNVDSAFQHPTPFYVNMTNDPSLGGVINGWTEGLSTLNKGAKARLYIPSGQAYGAQGRGEKIPPYSILMFDIEVLDILSKEVGGKIIRAEIKKMQDEQMKMQMQQQMMQQMQQQMQQQQQGQGQPQPPQPK